MIDLPMDANWAQDLRAIEDVDGVPMVSKLRRKDLKDPELQRHGDSAVMLALGWFATLNMSTPIDFTPVPRLPRGFDNLADDDSSLHEQGMDDAWLHEPSATW